MSTRHAAASLLAAVALTAGLAASPASAGPSDGPTVHAVLGDLETTDVSIPGEQLDLLRRLGVGDVTAWGNATGDFLVLAAAVDDASRAGAAAGEMARALHGHADGHFLALSPGRRILLVATHNPAEWARLRPTLLERGWRVERNEASAVTRLREALAEAQERESRLIELAEAAEAVVSPSRNGDRIADLRSIEQIVRTQIALYDLQHRAAPFDPVAQGWAQLTSVTDAKGRTLRAGVSAALTPAAAAEFGPYLPGRPINPFSPPEVGSLVLAAGDVGAGDVQVCGFRYDASTGRFHANRPRESQRRTPADTAALTSATADDSAG